MSIRSCHTPNQDCRVAKPRRIVLLLGLLLPTLVLAAVDDRPPGDKLDSSLTLAKGVRWLPGEFVAGQQPDGNSVIIETPDGLIVFDSGRHTAHSDRILAAARSRGLPIIALINSHWHLDHISGNPALRAAHPSLQVHASTAIDAALKGFLANYRKQLLQAIASEASDAQKATWQAEIARIDSGPQLRPSRPVHQDEVRRIGGRDLEFRLQHDTVSGGDVWVFDPQSRVLLAGDLVTLPAPFLDTACAPRWREALQRLASVDFDWLVPGHGRPMDKRELQHYISAFDRLLECAASPAQAFDCASAWKSDLSDLIPDAQTGQASQLLDYYVDQVLRGERANQHCPSDARALKVEGRGTGVAGRS